MHKLNKVSKKILELMGEKDITQQKLADSLNMTRQAISNYIRGVSEPDIDTLMRIANILDIDMNEITGFNDVDINKYEEILEETLQGETILDAYDIKELEHVDTKEEPWDK